MMYSIEMASWFVWSFVSSLYCLLGLVVINWSYSLILSILILLCFFFFQAEDGIRD